MFLYHKAHGEEKAEKGDSGCAPTVSGQKENGKNTPGGSKQQSGSDGTFPAFSESVKQKGKQYGKKKHREKGACQVADFPGPGKMTETGKAVQDKEKQVQNSYSKGEGFPMADKKGYPFHTVRSRRAVPGR